MKKFRRSKKEFSYFQLRLMKVDTQKFLHSSFQKQHNNIFIENENTSSGVLTIQLSILMTHRLTVVVISCWNIKKRIKKNKKKHVNRDKNSSYFISV